jgi:hypothetical protein
VDCTNTAMNRIAIVLIAGILPLGSAAAQMPALIKVTPCDAADRLFHSTNDDVHGMVRGRYRPDRDSTYVVVGSIDRGVGFAGRFAGHRADSLPVAQLTLFLRAGKGTEELTEGAMPQVTVVNDSTRLDLTPAQVGASRGGTIYIPVSAYVSPDNLLAIARAKNSEFVVGPIVIPLTSDDRRSLRALYHVALCGEVPAQ